MSRAKLSKTLVIEDKKLTDTRHMSFVFLRKRSRMPFRKVVSVDSLLTETQRQRLDVVVKSLRLRRQTRGLQIDLEPHVVDSKLQPAFCAVVGDSECDDVRFNENHGNFRFVSRKGKFSAGVRPRCCAFSRCARRRIKGRHPVGWPSTFLLYRGLTMS